MGIIELSNHLGIDKSVVSRLVKKGMPTSSADAANAWRATNAPPRNRADKKPPRIAPAPRPRKSPPPKVSNDTTPMDDSKNTPELSLRRAKEAEDSAHQKLKKIEMSEGSIEDYRKANGVYIAARNNRVKAQKDYDEWQRSEEITIFTDRAIELFQRTFGAGRQMLDVMPKTLAPRLVNQPQKMIERTLVEWSARFIETMRAKVWPKEIP